MTGGDVRRDEAMDGRLARTLVDARVAADDSARVIAAHRLAMGMRRRSIPDERHPDFLHPGRVVLILLLDTKLREPTALAAASLLESERPELQVPAQTVRAEIGDATADLLAAIPTGGDAWIEALVTASAEVRLVALAERLDQCRHAKFWTDRTARERILEQAQAVFGPVAQRTDAGLARRFAHWAGAFERSLRRGG